MDKKTERNKRQYKKNKPLKSAEIKQQSHDIKDQGLYL